MRETLLLVGPCGPPDGGTTVPFKLFTKYINDHCSQKYDIAVVNSTTGDKSSGGLIPRSMVLIVVRMVFNLIVAAVKANKIVVFGSQRNITIIGSLVVILFKPFGKKIYLRVNGGGYDIFYQRSSPIFVFLINNIVSRASAVVVQTEQVAAFMSQVLPNVRTLSNYRPMAVYDLAERQYCENQLVIIYTGIVRKFKGCKELLDAFLVLEERLLSLELSVSLRLDIYGTPLSLPNEPLDLSPYEHIENINFYGHLKNAELVEKYKEADIFAFPTYWPTEGHSGSVIEAMMYGLPVVSSDWRAMGEVVTQGVSGLFCKVQDVESLADAIAKIVMDTELRKTLSKGARDQSVRFDYEIVGEKFLEVFEL